MARIELNRRKGCGDFMLLFRSRFGLCSVERSNRNRPALRTAIRRGAEVVAVVGAEVASSPRPCDAPPNQVPGCGCRRECEEEPVRDGQEKPLGVRPGSQR